MLFLDHLANGGVMRVMKSWMDVSDLFMALTISNQPVAGSFNVSASRKLFDILDVVLFVDGPTRPKQTITWEYNVRFFYFGWEYNEFRLNDFF
jgi:hypothetical protein